MENKKSGAFGTGESARQQTPILMVLTTRATHADLRRAAAALLCRSERNNGRIIRYDAEGTIPKKRITTQQQ